MIFVLFSLLVVFLIWQFFRSNSRPTGKYYLNRGKWYWPKYLLTEIIIRWKRFECRSLHEPPASALTLEDFTEITAPNFPIENPNIPKITPCLSETNEDLVKSNFQTTDKVLHAQLENMRKRPLVDDRVRFLNGENAYQEVMFTGTRLDGATIVLRIARRSGNKADCWLILQLPEIGTFEHIIHPKSRISADDVNGFRCGGLDFEIVEPNRYWRISFNGMLRRCDGQSCSEPNQKLSHIRFALHWRALSPVCDFDFRKNHTSTKLISDAVARDPWPLSTLDPRKAVSHVLGKTAHNKLVYEQAGELIGVVEFEKCDSDERVSRYIRLRGFRRHEYGPRNWAHTNHHIVHRLHLENGTFIQTKAWSSPSISHQTNGFLIRPNAVRKPVEWMDLILKTVGQKQMDSFCITADNRRIRLHFNKETLSSSQLIDCRCRVDIIVRRCMAVVCGDGRVYQGMAVTEQRVFDENLNEDVINPHPPLSKTLLVDELDEVISLDFPNGVVDSVQVGGKANQLMTLMHLSQEINSTAHSEVQFSVKPGFVITTHSFHNQLIRNNILGSVEDILKANRENFVPSVVSKQLREVFDEKSFEFSEQLKTKVAANLNKTKLYAVRSSATDEDGTETSVAGQELTLLNVAGDSDSILSAVLRCWSSHFGQEALTYRHRSGLPINSLMAVVVQEMVPAETAGVVFTSDPRSGNPSTIVVNACSGLGEQVVSGTVQPDTFVLKKEMTNCSGISQVNIDHSQTKLANQHSGSCLADEQILSLARIGMWLEDRLGSARDIEFAIVGSTIWLLQARPITTLALNDDLEVMHEFDTPMTSELIWNSRANLGEVMWGAMTPLSAFVQARLCDNWRVVRKHFSIADKDVDCLSLESERYFNLYLQAIFLSMSEFHMFGEPNTPINDKRGIEMSFCGYDYPEITMDDLIEYMGKPSFFESWKRYLYARFIVGKHMLLKYDALEIQQQKEPYYPKGSTSGETIEVLANKLAFYVWQRCVSFTGSMMSVMLNGMLWKIITGDSEEWTSDHYADLAACLSQAQTISAATGDAIKQLSNRVAQLSETDLNKFLEISDTGEAWRLLKNNSELQSTIDNFMKIYGHRSSREFEMREPTWSQNQRTLVEAIRTNISSGNNMINSEPERPIEQVIRSLVCYNRLSRWERSRLRQIIPMAKVAVAKREAGKSLMIWGEEQLKVCFAELANQLYCEGRLPDRDLIYFLQPLEMFRLTQMPQPRIVRRAFQRRRIYGKLEGCKLRWFSWAELHRGVPKLLSESSADNARHAAETTHRLTGMPVSNGQARGRVVVIKRVEEATQIQNGDILVTHHTDIAWSPYFPLLAGLITEVGGVVSHGAVIARECNIPCLAHVEFATEILQTDDQVFLNGTVGYVDILLKK